jgi:hypothetical protein
MKLVFRITVSYVGCNPCLHSPIIHVWDRYMTAGAAYFLWPRIRDGCNPRQSLKSMAKGEDWFIRIAKTDVSSVCYFYQDTWSWLGNFGKCNGLFGSQVLSSRYLVIVETCVPHFFL